MTKKKAPPPSKLAQELATDDSKLYTFAGQVRMTTEKAVCIRDGLRDLWIPRSQLQNNKDGTFTIPTWLAIKKGLLPKSNNL